jgi:hypothetical protein
MKKPIQTITEVKNNFLDEVLDDTYVMDINPKIESEYCGCSSCMAEWEWADEHAPPNKEGFQLKDVI